MNEVPKKLRTLTLRSMETEAWLKKRCSHVLYRRSSLHVKPFGRRLESKTSGDATVDGEAADPLVCACVFCNGAGAQKLEW